MITLAIAQEKDIEAIIELLKPYMQESIYQNMTYSHEGTKAVVTEWLNGGFSFLAMDGERIIGFAQMTLMKTFYEEAEADVEMFYVMPEYRGMGISRMLVDNIVKNAEANNCAIIYTGCLSGIDEKNNALYTNLWSKFGFKELGTVMIKN